MLAASSPLRSLQRVDGPRPSAIGAYLWHGQFMSRARTRQAMGELFGVPVSPGAVTGVTAPIARPAGGRHVIIWITTRSRSRALGEQPRVGRDLFAVPILTTAYHVSAP